MQEILAGLEAFEPISALRFSRWAYAFVNISHVFGIALLVGGALPLSLRLLGLWKGVPRAGIVHVLAASAATGLGLAVVSGFTLFATRATEYASNPAFQVKLVLVLLGGCSAVLAHKRYGWDLETGSEGSARRIGVVSCLCWIGALVSGRLIAFIQG